MDNKRLIGGKGKLPWKLPADLRHFRRITCDKPVIMGSKTFFSIGSPLDKRHNIVLTRDVKLKIPGCTVCCSVEDALLAAGDVPEVMIIGGASVYAAFLPMAAKLYLTIIDGIFEGDCYFPEWNQREWLIAEKVRHQARADNEYAYDTLVMLRHRLNTYMHL